MNIQAIMKQAQEMQKKITKAQAELEVMTFTGKSSLVEVTVKGIGMVEKVSIEEENIDKEMLEDMILLAMNEAINKMQQAKEEKMGVYTKGMPGLF